MAKEKTPIINILTAGTPYKLSNQIYNEFQNRFKEAKYLIKNFSWYSELSEDIETVELLLALSIFHKRVVTNLDGAVKFYGTVTESGKTDTISIGSYNLNNEEKNKILGLLINYRKLIQRFGINESLMDYYHTKDFLNKVKYLKSDQEYGENQKEEGDEDLPF